jgi:hypothetical protein
MQQRQPSDLNANVTACAYCDTPGTLTRDHVWPACLLERTGGRAAHFSHKGGRVHGADYVVRDVCEHCNGVLLSPLDGYFCRLYDEYFAIGHGQAATVRFAVDYHLLTRALLKIAYNSARAAGSDDSYLRALRQYIRDGLPAPTQLAVFAELVSPTPVRDPSAPGGERLQLPTDFYRSAITKLLTPSGDRVHTRIVAVGSFYFHIVVPAEPMADSEFAMAADELGSHIAGVVRLTASTSEVSLCTSPQDAISSIVPHISQHSEAYRRFFQRRRP